MYQSERLLDLVASYWRRCLLDYRAGPEKAGQHYWSAKHELECIGWLGSDGTLKYGGAIPRHQQRI